MSKINLLPKWIFPDSKYSVYDTESGTAVEMVSKVYEAMRSLQIEYDSFADEINEKITNFINSTNQDQEEFKKEITKIMHDYIIKIDEKIKLQDLDIQDAINYMKTNLSESITLIIAEMRDSGQLSEDIMEAFEDFTSRLNSLEENHSNLESRVITLEGLTTYFTYNENNEELTLNINVEGGN